MSGKCSLGLEDIMMNQTVPALKELTFQWREHVKKYAYWR